FRLTANSCWPVGAAASPSGPPRRPSGTIPTWPPQNCGLCCDPTPTSRAASACCPKTCGCTKRWRSSTRKTTACAPPWPPRRPATRDNGLASRKACPEAVKAFDRLAAADPTNPEGWLRTPGLLRLATALLHQNRPRDAAALLKGGAKRRVFDGLPDAVDQVAV